jgi:hypothetical protein
MLVAKLAWPHMALVGAGWQGSAFVGRLLEASASCLLA